MKYNDVDKAQEIFSTTTQKSIVMYNRMIEGLGENNREKEALELFGEMSVTPNAYTYSILFKLCTQLSDRDVFEFCKTVWKKISNDNQKNLVVSTSFLQLLLKHEPMSICEEFFSRMEKNNVTYITMMKGLNIYALNFNIIFISFKGVFHMECREKQLISFIMLMNLMKLRQGHLSMHVLH